MPIKRFTAAPIHEFEGDIDTQIYEFCKEHYPEKADPPEWYRDGGIFDRIGELIKEICGHQYKAGEGWE